MTIPNFKSQEDWEAFTSLFDARWHCKKALLDRVKDDMYGRQGFPSPEWSSLPPHSVETINDITQSLLYDVEYTFKEEHPEYKTEDDDVFVPRSSFKESVTEALKEAMNTECPPCDVLQCADHLTDE